MTVWLVRVLAFAGGVAALYAGTLLYEDEYGRAQNKLEEWWLRFDDQQKVAFVEGRLVYARDSHPDAQASRPCFR